MQLIINTTLIKDLRNNRKMVRGVNAFMILFKISAFENLCCRCYGCYIEICDWLIKMQFNCD